MNTQKWKNRRGFYLRVTVANTDVRLMVWLKERFGGTFKDANTAKYYEGKNWKRAYHWGASSTRAAWLLYNCLPYFVIKGEQAEIGIQLQDSLSLGTPGLLGHSEKVWNERAALKQRLLTLKSKGIRGIPVPSGPTAKVS